VKAAGTHRLERAALRRLSAIESMSVPRRSLRSAWQAVSAVSQNLGKASPNSTRSQWASCFGGAPIVLRAKPLAALAATHGSMLHLPCTKPVPPAFFAPKWSRCLSTAAKGGSKEAVEIVTIFQAGIDKPELIEVNRSKRSIRARPHAVKAIQESLAASIPGIFSSLDDEGRDVVNWPAAADAAIDEYIKAHSGDASVLDSTFVYQGAFSVGVKRVKFLSLFSLILTSVGGPLLVIGEQAATMGQWAVAAAVVFFGTSTTGLLHIITSPYVISLRKIADGSFEAETPLITGGVKVTKFTKQDVMPSTRPFTSFMAKGQGFFVHKELFVGDDAQVMLCDILGAKVAEEMFEVLLKKDPNDLDTLYNYGRFLWKVRKDYAAAEGAFTAILAEDPNDREVLAAIQAIKQERGAAN